jgi:hypothetical protein
LRNRTNEFRFNKADISEWQDQAMGSRRKDLSSNQKSPERVRFTPNDIVRAIAGVEAAGLQVCGVEITPTGAINIWTQPSQAVADKQISTKPDETRPVKKQA